MQPTQREATGRLPPRRAGRAAVDGAPATGAVSAGAGFIAGAAPAGRRPPPARPGPARAAPAARLPAPSAATGLAVFAIARWEEPYIAEWVAYHLGLGADRVYVYDNEDAPTYAALLAGFGAAVEVVWFPGRQRQRAAIADFFARFRPLYEYALHIDVDEFVVPRAHRGLPELAAAFLGEGGRGPGGGVRGARGAAALALGWVWVGPGGDAAAGAAGAAGVPPAPALQERARDAPVCERFVWVAPARDRHCKVLFRCAAVRGGDVHSVQARGPTVDVLRRITRWPPGVQPAPAGAPAVLPAEILHFAFKSREEHARRRLSGRPDAVFPAPTGYYSEARFEAAFAAGTCRDTAARAWRRQIAPPPGLPAGAAAVLLAAPPEYARRLARAAPALRVVGGAARPPPVYYLVAFAPPPPALLAGAACALLGGEAAAAPPPGWRDGTAELLGLDADCAVERSVLWLTAAWLPLGALV